MGPRALSQMHGNNTEHGHDAKPTCAICPPVGSLYTHVNHALPSIKWDTVAWNDLHLRGLIQTMSELSHIDGCRVTWEIFLRVNSSPSNPDSIVLTGFIWLESLWKEWRHYNCKWVAKLTSFFFLFWRESVDPNENANRGTESLLGVDRQAYLCYLYRLSRFLPWGIVITYYISFSLCSLSRFFG